MARNLNYMVPLTRISFSIILSISWKTLFHCSRKLSGAGYLNSVFLILINVLYNLVTISFHDHIPSIRQVTCWDYHRQIQSKIFVNLFSCWKNSFKCILLKINRFFNIKCMVTNILESWAAEFVNKTANYNTSCCIAA